MTTETDIIITDCIDWLRFTVSRDTDLDLMLPVVPSLARTGDINEFGHHGYNRTMPLMGGGGIYWHSEKRDMKYMVDLPGGALAELRRDGFEVEDIMINAISKRLPDLRYKRIDYAVDLHNSGATVNELWKHYEKGKVKTSARKARFISSIESEYASDTVEFGSRESSPRFVRVYNKAGQMGKLWESWLRIEAEMKGVRVDGFAMQVIRHGRGAAGRREITEAVQTKVKWFNAAMAGELAPHMEVPRPESKPNLFVLNTIIPFIGNHSEELTEDTKRKLLAAIRDYITLPG